MFFIKSIWVSSAGIIINVSSAYCITGKSTPKSGEKGALSRPDLKALLIADCSRSAARTKIRGERGSPCLTPQAHNLI
jgi:hypothetical protein